jgi:hypothetical protein
MRTVLRRKRHDPRLRPCESAGELGEDRQVSVQPNPFQPTDAKRSERPFVLQAAELALDPGRASRSAGSHAGSAGAGGRP